MLVIRFNRVGRKNYAQFRIVVQQRSAAPGGRHIAIVGSYDPHHKKGSYKEKEIIQWLAKGAQASDAVHNLLVKEGVIKGKKRKIKLTPKKGKEAAEKDEKEKALSAKGGEDKKASEGEKELDKVVEEKIVEKKEGSISAVATEDEEPKK